MRQDQLQQVKALLPQLTFGVEVEVTGIHSGGQGNTVASRMNSLAGLNGQQRWRNTHDGSVFSGSEFVTGIMPYETLETVQEGVREIHRSGGRPHSSCGIHVHIDGRRFINDPQALIRLIKSVNKYENQVYHALGGDTPARRGRWAQAVKPEFLSAIERLPKNCSIDDIRRAWYDTANCGCGHHHHQYCRSRYRGLNLHALWRIGTIEFRWFNATTHAGKIKAYVQLSALICAQALTSKKGSSKKRSFEPSKAKYEVRTMLLKIGAIGDEFKTLRLHMTRHLEGNASWHRQG